VLIARRVGKVLRQDAAGALHVPGGVVGRAAVEADGGDALVLRPVQEGDAVAATCDGGRLVVSGVGDGEPVTPFILSSALASYAKVAPISPPEMEVTACGRGWPGVG
jgi:hypothetical protein